MATHSFENDTGFNMMVSVCLPVLQWLSSYLTDRSQYISLFNHCSAFAPVHSDVPQSSVLGPILFYAC